MEQLKMLTNFAELKIKRKKCPNLYYVTLYNDEKSVISMMVATYPELKAEQHQSIVKNPYYMLYEFLYNKKNPPYSSMMLHSFVCDMIGQGDADHVWCAAPMSQMSKILSKMNSVKPSKELWNVINNRRSLCNVYNNITACYKCSEMGSFWKQGRNFDVSAGKGTFMGIPFIPYIVAQEY
jgi:hypothetical protein